MWPDDWKPTLTGRGLSCCFGCNQVLDVGLLQCGLRKKVCELGLVVEVNPTSNLLIGNLADLTHHPLWRLNPPTGQGDAPPVAICIGSDDPLTFATGLPEEYQLLHDSLTLSGLSYEQASQWLDRVRSVGLDTRFTLRLEEDYDPVELRCDEPALLDPMP